PAVAQSRHDQALADLRRTDDADARRAAVRALADTGVMADLPAMAQALRDSDPMVRALTESAMWEIWSRSGDAEIDALFTRGVEQLQSRQLDEAIQTFTRVIARRPDFAEAWNKRATAWFVLGEYAKSLADCDEVMARNPYHWGALSGYGMIYAEMDQPGRAVEYFEKALAVNPNLTSVRQAIETLKALLLQRRREMI
ncbi:MAG TPA: tetratricopeptide repeat protein, partial [Candidatus Binatia bacterium]|nr:tetratricopeptide repeat protein [Candidatus Binatia bacterium]